MIVRPDAPPLTVEHYRNLSETGPRYQLIDGDLYMAPAPNRYHQDISRNLEFILLAYLASNPIGVLFHAPFDVYLTETDVFQPDIVIIFNENRHILTDTGAEGPPDFVVEIFLQRRARLIWKTRRELMPGWGWTNSGSSIPYHVNSLGSHSSWSARIQSSGWLPKRA